jgi:hypothetical protein
VGEIHITPRLEIGPSAIVDQGPRNGGTLFGGEGWESAGLDLGMNAEQRRRSGVEVNVGSAGFHGGAKYWVEHRVIGLSAFWGTELMFMNRSAVARG